MAPALRILASLLTGIAFLLAACAGDESESQPTSTATPSPGATQEPSPSPALSPTPSPALSPTPTPAPSPTPSPAPEAPHAAPIELDPGVDSLAEDVLLPTLQAGGILNLDSVKLAEGLGITPPPCAALVFYLSWQVRQPYPPADVDVQLYWTRMGGTELIGQGPSGQTSGGCGIIQVGNNSDVEITVEIRYAIGELTG
jgi:hypothetical protein